MPCVTRLNLEELMGRSVLASIVPLLALRTHVILFYSSWDYLRAPAAW